MKEFKIKLKNFAKYIRKLRIENDITISDLSKLTGISAKYLHKIEQSEAKGIRLSHFERLSEGLNVNLSILFDIFDL